MKKNVRKALAISGMTLAIGASGFVLDASAHQNIQSRVQRSHQERIFRTKIDNAAERISRGRRATTGFVSSVSENSITISKGSKELTVQISPETRLLDKSWKSIRFSDIKVGNKVKVFGTDSSGVISAKTIRNISL